MMRRTVLAVTLAFGAVSLAALGLWAYRPVGAVWMLQAFPMCT